MFTGPEFKKELSTEFIMWFCFDLSKPSTKRRLSHLCYLIVYFDTQRPDLKSTFERSSKKAVIALAQVGLLGCMQRDGVQGIKVPYHCEKIYNI